MVADALSLAHGRTTRRSARWSDILLRFDYRIQFYISSVRAADFTVAVVIVSLPLYADGGWIGEVRTDTEASQRGCAIHARCFEYARSFLYFFTEYVQPAQPSERGETMLWGPT